MALATYPVQDYQEDPLIGQRLLEARYIKTPNRQFKYAVKEIGKGLAHRIAAKGLLPTTKKIVTTGMGYSSQGNIVDVEQIKVLTILRAALPFSEGVIDAIGYEEDPDEYFAWLSRDENTLEARPRYIEKVDATGATLLIPDIMLATGGSEIKAVEHVLENGKPKKIAVIGAVASEYGIDKLKAFLSQLDVETHIFTASIDTHYEEGFMGRGLNGIGYIVPGLGDAGDRARRSWLKIVRIVEENFGIDAENATPRHLQEAFEVLKSKY